MEINERKGKGRKDTIFRSTRGRVQQIKSLPGKRRPESKFWVTVGACLSFQQRWGILEQALESTEGPRLRK